MNSKKAKPWLSPVCLSRITRALSSAPVAARSLDKHPVLAGAAIQLKGTNQRESDAANGAAKLDGKGMGGNARANKLYRKVSSTYGGKEPAHRVLELSSSWLELAGACIYPPDAGTATQAISTWYSTP